MCRFFCIVSGQRNGSSSRFVVFMPFCIPQQLLSIATNAVLFSCEKLSTETGQALLAFRARAPATEHQRPSTCQRPLSKQWRPQLVVCSRTQTIKQLVRVCMSFAKFNYPAGGKFRGSSTFTSLTKKYRK